MEADCMISSVTLAVLYLLFLGWDLCSWCMWFLNRWKMPPGSDDPRKLFILTTAGNYFSLDTPASLSSCRPLNDFLDDGNEFLLTVTRNTDELQFSNKVLWVTYSCHIYYTSMSFTCKSHNKWKIFLFLLTDILSFTTPFDSKHEPVLF